MKITNIISLLTILAISSFFMTACVAEDPTPVGPKEYGKILLFHGAPSVSPVDLYINGTKTTGAAIGYGFSSSYVQTEAGATAHKIITKNALGATLDSTNLKVNKDIGYSYYVYQDSNATKTIRVLATTDVLSAPAATKAKVRVVHLIPDVLNNIAVDIEIITTGKIATTRNDFFNIKFRDIKDFIEITKGTYDVHIKKVGTINVLLTIPNITISEGKIYTLVTYGLLSKASTDPLCAKMSVINNN